MANLVIENIAKLRLRKGTAHSKVYVLGYYTENDRGGGNFYWNSSSTATEDNGFIIKVTGVTTGRWIRIIEDGVLYPEFYGAKGDGTTDDYNAVRACLDLAKTEKITKIQFLGKTYLMGTTLDIDTDIFMQGIPGYAGSNSTKLRFLYPTSGLTMTFPDAVRLEGIEIASNKSYPRDEDHVGIYSQTQCHFNDVTISGFAGKGLKMIGSAEVLPLTSVDHSTAFNLKITGCGSDGLYLQGADANIVMFNNLEIQACNGWGINDQSFLGNYYANVQIAGCMSPELAWQQGLCKFGGQVYSALKTGLLGHPTITPTDWYTIDATRSASWILFPSVLDYNAATVYKAGGAVNVDEENIMGHNQFTTFVGLYTEGDCPPSYWSEKVVAIGGTNGAGIREGLFLTGFNRYLNVNTGVRTSNVDPTASDLYTLMTPDGYTLGSYANTIQGGALWWNDDKKWQQFVSFLGYPGTSSYSGLIIPTQDTPASDVGRNTNDFAFLPFSKKMYIRENDLTGNYTTLEGGNAVTSTGRHEKGDFKFNTAPVAGDNIIGWRCVTAGTPGTWETMYFATAP